MVRTAPRPPGPRDGPDDQAGSLALLQATWLLVLVVLVGLATLDVGALLRGARVATAAADGAALAAATASRTSSSITPRAAADRIAREHGATLTVCDCSTGADAHVTVTLPVPTRLLHHLGLTEVRGAARARLVPLPADADP